MERTNYWLTRTWSRRQTVRLFAATTGATAMGALMACGGKTSTSGQGAASGTQAGAATGTPKRGGTLTISQTADPSNLSPYTAAATGATNTSLIYSKLLRFHQGFPGVKANNSQLDLDLASKYEQPDDSTYVFTLQPGVKWQNVAPINGRPLTAEDVRLAMEGYRSDPNSGFLSDWQPVATITVPDTQTVRVTTTQPYAPFLNTLIAGNYGARVFPKELADGDKLKTQAVGTGPFILDSWKAGDSIVLRSNPDYFRSGTPYLDKLVSRVIPTPASVVAAFQTEQIDVASLTVDQATQVKRTNPKAAVLTILGFGEFTAMNTTKAPYNDKRVRQALSMGLNRLAARTAFYNNQGDYDELIGPGVLDRGLSIKDLGASGNYWNHDVAEAKKLLAAAGYANGFDAAVANTPFYGDVSKSELEEAISDWGGIGVRATPSSPTDIAQWLSSVYRPPFKFDDILWGAIRSYQDPDPILWYWLHPTGISNQSRVNDTQITSLVEKQRATVNTDDRWNVIHQIERIVADQQYYIYRNTGVNNYALQPWVKNWGPVAGYYNQAYEHVWIDRA